MLSPCVLQDYYRRYKVCLKHASSPMVMLRGIPQRFCQQCGTFHPIGEFDADKRCASGLSLLRARSGTNACRGLDHAARLSSPPIVFPSKRLTEQIERAFSSCQFRPPCAAVLCTMCGMTHPTEGKGFSPRMLWSQMPCGRTVMHPRQLLVRSPVVPAS